MKLTRSNLMEIQRLHKAGISNCEIAGRFGVCEGSIRYHLEKGEIPIPEPRMCAYDKERICDKRCAAHRTDHEVTVSVLERAFEPNGQFEWVVKSRRLATFCTMLKCAIDDFDYNEKKKLIEGGPEHED